MNRDTPTTTISDLRQETKFSFPETDGEDRLWSFVLWHRAIVFTEVSDKHAASTFFREDEEVPLLNDDIRVFTRINSVIIPKKTI